LPPESRNIRTVVAELIAHVPPVARATYWAAGRADESPRTYRSPLEAAGAADRYYATKAVRT
jgi:hypothetical protein